MALTINLEDHFNYTLLELHGEVNANTAVILQKSIDISTENGHRHLVFDCSMLTSISSEGLRVLLNCQRRLPHLYSLSMCSVSRPIAALLELSGMTHFLRISQDIHEVETLLMEGDYSTGRPSSDHLPSAS